MGSRPIRRAKSSCSPHLSIGLLVLALQGKTFKIPPARIPPQTSSPPPIPSNYSKTSVPTAFTLSRTHHHLQSGLPGRRFLDLFDVLNQAVVSVCPQHHWFLCYKQNRPNFSG